MGRLKKYKFNDIGDFLEFNENNIFLIQKLTLEKLEKYFESKQKIGLVDIFEIQLSENKDQITKMTIFEKEWDDALDIVENTFVGMEEFILAARARDLKIKIKK